MEKIVIFLLVVLACSATTWGYYISDVTVAPAAPTTADEVCVTVSGNAPATNYALNQVDTWSIGSMIFVDMYWISMDMGGAALVPYEETVPLGALAAGKYTVYVRSYDAGMIRKRESVSFTVAKEAGPSPNPWSWSWSWSWGDGSGFSFSGGFNFSTGGGGSSSIISMASGGSASSTSMLSTTAAISN